MAAARRVVAAAALAAKEYSLRDPQETAEAKLFIQQARFDIPVLPAAVRRGADSGLTQIALLLDRLAPPDSVGRAAEALIVRIGIDEPIPSQRPCGAAWASDSLAACVGACRRSAFVSTRSLTR